MKTKWWIVILVLAFIFVAIYLYNNKILIFSLPRSKDKDVFGPPYWKSFETIAHNIPCPPCRQHGEQLVSFMHDVVNLKLGKPIYNKENFSRWKKYICEEDTQQTQ